MDIQTQDGIILRGIPDGTPEEAIKARLAKIRAGGSQQQPAPAPQAPQPQTTAGGVASEVGKGLLRGPSDLGMAMGRTGANMFLGPFMGPVAARGMETLAAPSRGMVQPTPATPTERFAGTAAELGAAGLAGGGAGSVPGMIGAGASALGGAVGEQMGGETGKVVGSLSPLAMSPVVSGVGAGLRAGRNVIDPWLAGGTKRAAVRTAGEAAGPDRAAIAALLRNPQQMVPGSAPTAGEAAAPVGRAEFSGLQELVKGRAPTEYENIAQSQNAARVRALRTVGQDKPALQAAAANRASTAATNYGAARGQVVDIDPQMQAILENPILQAPLKRAAVLSAGRGTPLNLESGQVTVGQLQDMKMALDDVLKNPETFGIGASEAQLIGTLQRQLVAMTAAKSPAWENARSTFAAQSRPINQMEVGQYLEGKLSPALTDLGASGNQRSQVYAQALRDAPATLKRATGQPRYSELPQVMEPQQMSTLTGVGQDLARASTHERLAKAGAEKARDLVGQITPKVPAAGMFNPHYSVLRAISNRLAGKIEGKSLDELARLMQSGNTKELGEALARMPLKQRGALVKALREARAPMYAGGVAAYEQ